MAERAGPDELHLPGGLRARVQVGGEATEDAFTLITDEAPPGWRTPRHRHAHESETIHVVAGRLWLEVDGRRRELGPGDTAHVPRGAAHAGGTLGDEPVRRVLVFAPAGADRLLEAVHRADGPEAVAALFAGHGWTPA